MKTTEVPQDQDPTFEGGKKLCYAVDESGKFVPVKTSGWTVEAEAKDLAWKAINTDLEKTKVLVQKGQASPLEYFMKLRQMDKILLAQNMEISVLRTWWHLRPKNFSKLGDKWLVKYSDCLKVPVETLKNYRGE